MKINMVFCVILSIGVSYCDKTPNNIFKKSIKIEQDIQDCDNVGDYYNDGSHYIRRDLVTEGIYAADKELATEYNVIDYQKLFEAYDLKKSKCNPARK